MRRGSIVLCALALIAGLFGVVPALAGTKSTHGTWQPKARGELDCNGFSPVQAPVAHLQCTDFRGKDGHRAEDNGHYVGHDEPLNQFLSNTPGSGNAMTYKVQLPTEPASPPNGSFAGPVWTYQLSIAPWVSMVMCDTQSWPEGGAACPRDSDANIQVPPQPNHAGAAFMELQLYPPGWNPFITQISCDQTHWCAALTIDSLQFNFDFSQFNPNCEEPVNFGFLSHDGVPAGPPGPDTATNATFTPNADTLLMNPGDSITIQMHDSRAGLFTMIKDATTGGSGKMVASSANGFRHINWDPVGHTCVGSAYSFHPMYSTSHTYTSIPTASNEPETWAGWTAHTVNVAYQMEIGHFEQRDGDRDDTGCHSGPTIPGCTGTDTDFDGYPYHKDWPNGSANFPTPFLVNSPKSLDAASGHYVNPYGDIQFETDLPAVESTCNVLTGSGCVNPPPGAKFYPWFHENTTTCQWALSNDISGYANFGGEVAAWGPLETTDYGGGFIASENYASGNLTNPCP